MTLPHIVIGARRGRLSWGASHALMTHAGLALVVLLAVAAPARAQIHSWHDANGRLVLSNVPRGHVEHTYAVPRAESILVTRPGTALHNRDYDDLITEHARLNAVRPDLVRAVIQVESAYNPNARSPKGAMGLMQLMPGTAQLFRVRDAFNPTENVRAGVAYLRHLLDRYQNDEQLALAAYNAGPGAVDKHGQSIPPYRETRDYVARINGLAARPVEVPVKKVIYKTIDIIDGRAVLSFSDRKPAGSFELVPGSR